MIDSAILTIALVVIATVAVVILASIPRKAAAATLSVLMLFGVTLEHLSKVPALGYIDEASVALAVALFALPRAAQRLPLHRMPGTGFFLGFAALGFTSGIVYQTQLAILLPAAFLSLKGVIFAWAICQLDWAPTDVYYIVRISAVVLLAILISGLINIALPIQWTALFSVDAAPDYRGPIPSVIGFFTHPGVFGYFMSLATTACIAFMITRSTRAHPRLFVVASMLGVVLSFRRKSFIAVIAGIAWLAARARSAVSVTIAVLSAPVAALLAWGSIERVISYSISEYLTNPDETARYVLTRDSLGIAWAHFPFGVGFGRFGSYIAGQDYSPEYIRLGYRSIWGLSDAPGRGAFLTDTMWPAAIGETGFIGATLFALGLITIFRTAKRLQTTSDTNTRFCALVVGAWSIQVAIESVAFAAYNSPPTFQLLFLAYGIMTSLGRRDSAPTTDTAPRKRTSTDA